MEWTNEWNGWNGMNGMEGPRATNRRGPAGLAPPSPRPAAAGRNKNLAPQ